MRLHNALDHIRSRSVRTMEPWAPSELQEMCKFVDHHSSEIVEFTFDYLDTDRTSETLQTFISFADEMWDHQIAPIPHRFFWVSWSQRVLDVTVRMAAFCERVESPTDKAVIGLSIQVMFENHRATGLSFINQVGHLVIGDHKNAIVNYATNESAALLVDNGFGIVKALLGALATPQAIRREEGAPDKLNKARLKKGKEPIRRVIVIDVRESQQAAIRRRSEGSWSVRPHWRRGHIRRLQNDRFIPIPPCCINMEDGVPIKPEYVVRI